MIAVNICTSPDPRYPTIEDIGDPDRIVPFRVGNADHAIDGTGPTAGEVGRTA